MASFDDVDYFETTCARVVSARTVLTESLEALGFHVLPSAANFVFVSHARHAAAQLSAQLRDHGVLVRHFKQPRISNFLRITVGSDEQNTRLIACLRAVLCEAAD